jgi:hypothetical protein
MRVVLWTAMVLGGQGVWADDSRRTAGDTPKMNASYTQRALDVMSKKYGGPVVRLQMTNGKNSENKCLTCHASDAIIGLVGWGGKEPEEISLPTTVFEEVVTLSFSRKTPYSQPKLKPLRLSYAWSEIFRVRDLNTGQDLDLRLIKDTYHLNEFELSSRPVSSQRVQIVYRSPFHSNKSIEQIKYMDRLMFEMGSRIVPYSLPPRNQKPQETLLK